MSTQKPATMEIGHMLRAGTSGFVFGCRVAQWDAPSFGALVRVPQTAGNEIYGLIYDIHYLLGDQLAIALSYQTMITSSSTLARYLD